MSLLTATQSALIKKIRAKARTRDFTVETVTRTDGADYYDAPTTATTSVALKGDYTWREQSERTGTPGGIVDRAELILVTDIAHSSIVRAPNARLVVQGVRYAVIKATEFEDTGEVVVVAVKL